MPGRENHRPDQGTEVVFLPRSSRFMGWVSLQALALWGEGGGHEPCAHGTPGLGTECRPEPQM